MPRNKLATALGGAFEGLAQGIQIGTQRRATKEQISASKLGRLTNTLALLPSITKNMGEDELNNLSDLLANEFSNVMEAPPEQLKGIANKLVRAEPERLKVLGGLSKELESINSITNPDEKIKAMNNYSYKLVNTLGGLGALNADQVVGATIQLAKLVGDQEQLKATLYNKQRTRKLSEDRLINTDISNYMTALANDTSMVEGAKLSLMQVIKDTDAANQEQPIDVRRAEIAKTVSSWKTYYQRTNKYPTLKDINTQTDKNIDDMNKANSVLNNTNLVPGGKPAKKSIFERIDKALGFDKPNPLAEALRGKLSKRPTTNEETILQDLLLESLKPKRKPYKPTPIIVDEIDLSSL